MLDVIIALIPALVWSVYVFSWRALSVTAVSVASCVVFEFLYRKIMRKPDTIGDLSAVVTGVLLAFCLPVGVPMWMPVLGAFFAIVIVKQLYGGIGKNADRTYVECRTQIPAGEKIPEFQKRERSGAYLFAVGNVSARNKG